MINLIKDLIMAIKDLTSATLENKWALNNLEQHLREIKADLNEFRRIEHESILPNNQKVIDEAYKLRNGLYSWKKTKSLIRE